jgi:hypothetical protein
MSKSKLAQIATDAFFDNFSFAALFGKLNLPVAPDRLIDPRSLDEYLAHPPVHIWLELGAPDRTVPRWLRRDTKNRGDRTIVPEIPVETPGAVLVDWSVSSFEPLDKMLNSR